MTSKHYPIVVYEVPDVKENGKLWREGGLTALAQAIVASLEADGLKFLPDGDIIEVPVRVKEEA